MAHGPLAELTRLGPFVDTGRLVRSSRKLPRDRVTVNQKSPPNSNVSLCMSTGKYSEADCTVKFLLDWAWKSVADIKQLVDVTTVPLFDWSVSQVSEPVRRTLTQSCQQLKHLHVIIEEMIEQVLLTLSIISGFLFVRWENNSRPKIAQG